MVTQIQGLPSQSDEPTEEAVAHSQEFIAMTFTGLPPIDFPAISQKAESPRHDQLISVGFLRDGRLRINKPFEVRFEAENDDIIAEAQDFNEFGFGKTTADALADLQRAIAELYLTLEEDQERLGNDLLETWKKLQAHIAKR